jgi:murein DD-endopeptidase MepM/ murein hydrolase activator NlpD
MAYEHVLAAADGVVTMARWNVTNCHNGVGCNYGLEVRIRRIVNDHTYLTNYGHLTTLAVQVGQSIVINVARDVAFDPGQVIASHVTAPCG